MLCPSVQEHCVQTAQGTEYPVGVYQLEEMWHAFTQEAAEGQQSHEPGQNGHISLFDWGRQWYPLAFVEDLDPKVNAV